MNKERKWLQGKIYEGKTIVILGQGPSLQDQDSYALSSMFTTIAIKDSFRLANYPEIIYACDKDWWKRTWLKDDGIREHKALRVVMDYSKLDLRHIPDLRYLHYTGVYNFDFNEGCVRSGNNSGHSAVNLAVNLGARKCILLGYDMCVLQNKTHFDGCPHIRVPHDVFDMFRSNLTQAAKLLEGKMEVVNCSKQSALKCFPKMSIAEAIQWGMK